MTDLTQVIRWNANFVRGLAESVLNRAKGIRASLSPVNASSDAEVQASVKKSTRAATEKTAKRAAKPAKKASARKGKAKSAKSTGARRIDA